MLLTKLWQYRTGGVLRLSLSSVYQQIDQQSMLLVSAVRDGDGDIQIPGIAVMCGILVVFILK